MAVNQHISVSVPTDCHRLSHRVADQFGIYYMLDDNGYHWRIEPRRRHDN
jgi:hypothetical protein